MRRVDRRRLERVRRRALMIGLSFALGALVDTALTWRLHEFEGSSVALTGRASSAPAQPPGSATVQPVATTGSVPAGATVRRDLPANLRARHLEMPVEGIKPSNLRDSFSESRAFGRPHEAIDIIAPKGTRVFAVEDGTVAKLFRSVAGGLTVYQFDPTGEYAYYYAHLDSYAAGLREGQTIRRGQTIGFVGSTGNASATAPHLHFAIYRLTPERKWWKGDAINPYPLLR
jgi:murein DD-endopeptidase MepM/ murein hydrolase activator NlpD